MPESLSVFSEFLKIALQIANVVIIGYALYKFLNKPRNTLEEKVNEHDVKINEIESSLKQGNDRFRDTRDTNEVLQICMLALIDFELNFCSHTGYEEIDDLAKAKNILREHLARRRNAE